MKTLIGDMDPLELVTPVLDSEEEHSIGIETEQIHCKKCTGRIDEEELIACVFKRSAVWDKKNKYHGNRNVVDKCWLEISREMEIDDTVLRKKWKYLRDQFAVELTKFSGETQTSKWRYLYPLMFLKDCVKTRPLTGKLSGVVLTSEPASLRLLHKEEYYTDDVEPSLQSKKSVQCKNCDKRFTRWMDLESLIASVFQRPAVWDRKRKIHSNRKVVDRCWGEISREMKYDEKECRQKWKYLRDQFAVELGKFPHSRSGTNVGDTQTSKWRYFQLLMFLRGVVKPRTSNRNFSDGLTSDSEEHLATFPLQTQKSPVQSDVNKRQKRQYLLEKSTKKHDREEDEDLLFFKSLLPHIKNIPDSKKLTFRNRIQEVVEKHAYQVLPVSPTPNRPSYTDHTSQSSFSSSPTPSSPDSSNCATENFS